MKTQMACKNKQFRRVTAWEKINEAMCSNKNKLSP